jgi:hypothetical protein
MRNKLYVNVVERTKSAADFTIILLQGTHACGVHMEGEGEIGLSTEGAAGPLENRKEALELLEKDRVWRRGRGLAGEVKGVRKIDLENSYARKSTVGTSLKWPCRHRPVLPDSCQCFQCVPVVFPSVFFLTRDRSPLSFSLPSRCVILSHSTTSRRPR